MLWSVNEGNHSWIHWVDSQAGRMCQTQEVSAHFLVRLYYQVWWWRMLYPCIDFLQVLILELGRVLPSASSKQRTETVKTPHNSFQWKTTVMDYRLFWKGGDMLSKHVGRAPTGATLMRRKTCPSFLSSFFLPVSFLPSLPPSIFLSFLPPLPHLISKQPFRAYSYSAFYKWGK